MSNIGIAILHILLFKVEDLRQVKKKYGFCGVPITENGKLGGKLLGIVTSRDIAFAESEDSYDIKLESVRKNGRF